MMVYAHLNNLDLCHHAKKLYFKNGSEIHSTHVRMSVYAYMCT